MTKGAKKCKDEASERQFAQYEAQERRKRQAVNWDPFAHPGSRVSSEYRTGRKKICVPSGLGMKVCSVGELAVIKYNVMASQCERARTGIYAMMDPCHLYWRSIDLQTHANAPHTRTRAHAHTLSTDHPGRRGHLMRFRRKPNTPALPSLQDEVKNKYRRGCTPHAARHH